MADVKELFTYDVMSNLAASILDKYDFNKELEFCRHASIPNIRDAWNVREYILDMNNEEVEFALDELSLDEFMEYMNDRYNIRWEVIITYKMIM